MPPEIEEVNADTPVGKFSLKSANLGTIMLVLILVGVSLLVYMVFAHERSQTETRVEFIGAVKEQTLAIRESAAAQREASCVFSQRDPVFCRNMGR